MLLRLFSGLHVRLYRLTGGRFVGRIGKAPILILTTTGRRSGTVRTTPLLYLRAGNAFAVVASFGGSPTHPAWYLNLTADPKVEVQVGRERFHASARTATSEERARLWSLLLEIYPTYESYQRKTNREIPVVLLEPRTGLL